MDPDTPYTLQFFKNPEVLHWRLDTLYLGSDDHGLWLSSPAGTVAQKGSSPARTIRNPGVHLVPHSAWWVLSFHPTAPDITHFLDMSTPAKFEDSRVTMVDLDLDVLAMVDGSVALDDEDEFSEHQVLFAYPDEWIREAERSATWCMEALRVGAEPFRETATAWWARSHSS